MPSTAVTIRSDETGDLTIPLACALVVPGGVPEPGYQLGSMLGRGGEGEVHEARQLAFGRTVAIKTLRRDIADPRQLRRFQAEAAITALLEHPNIVPVHDLRSDAEGRPQLVMKRVSGRNWREVLEAGGLTVDEHVAILLKVCDAVEFAHGTGVLHRDLKPENIMVGAHGEVLVMDWGCAAHLGPEAPHPDIPLVAGLDGLSGTPVYMSPEQARGDHAACGPWSDVHLLGAILYRILTGTVPRQGTDVRGIVAAAACGEPVPDPGTRITRRLSVELSAIAMAALHPEAAQRTRSVTEFAAALRRYLEHREVLELVAEARRQHEAAMSGGPAADDAFRRGLCAVEQAVRLWPELLPARRLLVTVGIDAAAHAGVTGALRQSVRLAEAAAAAAVRLGDDAAAQRAQRIAVQSAADETRGQQRERALRRVRTIAAAAAIVALLSLAAGMLLSRRESQRTAAALAVAQANLEQAERERAERVAGERRAGPALLAQARELAQARRFADGIPLAETAAGFLPGDPRPLQLKAELLIALGRRPEAVVALDALLALTPDPMLAELRQLCATPPADAEARIADVLMRLGAGAAAGELNLASDRRVALATAQLRLHWPALPAGSVRALPDGTLQLRLGSSELRIDSLEPLRGLPIASLDISGQERLRDLAPLAGLPLTTLVARTTGVRDFSPLRGLPLRRLQLGWYERGFDLGMVRGAPLEVLEAPGANLVGLPELAGMPLRDLRLFGCNRLSDLSALRDLPLDILTLEAPKTGSQALSDLTPLAGKPLVELNLSWQRGVCDVAPLRGAPLRRVVLNGTGVADLAPVLSPALRVLAIGATPVSDVRALAQLPLDSFDCSPQSLKLGLEDVLRLPNLRQVCGFRAADFPQWLQLSRALTDANPDYPWTGTGAFRDGRLVELRLTCPLRSLAPLADLHDLRILQLGGTPTDLRPLADLPLEELVCTPSRTAAGLDALRSKASLLRMGSSPQTLRPAAGFWREFDASR